ncbi:hypothetical protein CCYA_CCYA11G3170 [Cyanidiococcus yangmingshanensis]|nr:hypothetical protein CCYA_CCYA11G3170 [Cyanidiococcus yangmingshanensis]
MRRANSCSVLAEENEPNHWKAPALSPLQHMPLGVAFCERQMGVFRGRDSATVRALLADAVLGPQPAGQTKYIMPGMAPEDAHAETKKISSGFGESVQSPRSYSTEFGSGSDSSDETELVVPNIGERSPTSTAVRRAREVALNKRLSLDEIYRIIELLFRHAGLDDSSSPEEVVEALGEDGLELLLRFYTSVTEYYLKQRTESSLDRSERLQQAMRELEARLRREHAEDDSLESKNISENLSGALHARGGKTEFQSQKLVAASGPQSPAFNERAVKRQRTDAEGQLSLSASDSSEEYALQPSLKYKADTEIAMSRIFALGSVVPPRNPHIKPDDPYQGPPVITMTGFGELGRWGNQILQYAFLRVYASKCGAQIQVPEWVGKAIFGLQDSPVERAFPAVVEHAGAKANSTFTNQFLDYIRESNVGREVPEVRESDLAPDVQPVFVNRDFWGWFQWHTSHYRPYRDLLRQAFNVVPELASHLDCTIARTLRKSSKRGPVTLVGLHLRLGDYKNIAASSFGYCAPTSWYLEWLQEIWPTLNNPVLFVASDDIDAVLRDFRDYHPVTCDMLGIEMPSAWKGMGAGFFPDWYVLTQCDVLAISNSTFSFTACMFNQQDDGVLGGKPRFYRAHYSQRMVPFDPWDAEPVLHRDGGTWGALQLLYQTQGTRGLVRNVLYEMPYYRLRDVIMKTVLRARALRKRVTAAA